MSCIQPSTNGWRVSTSLTPYEALKEFHKTYGLVVREPGDPIDFSLENDDEWEELLVAWVDEDLVGYADAVCDLVYVLVGSLVSFGVDFDKCFAEVHRSNMSKLDVGGKPIVREDGKILKGPNFTQPDLRSIIYGRAANEVS